MLTRLLRWKTDLASLMGSLQSMVLHTALPCILHHNCTLSLKIENRTPFGVCHGLGGSTHTDSLMATTSLRLAAYSRLISNECILQVQLEAGIPVIHCNCAHYRIICMHT
jgi:hypothetical protein